jgi:hypothetical protein
MLVVAYAPEAVGLDDYIPQRKAGPMIGTRAVNGTTRRRIGGLSRPAPPARAEEAR